MNMKKLIKYLLITFFLVGCASSEKNIEKTKVEKNDHFVTVKGTHFYIGDKPYYYSGTNMWYGAYLGAPKKIGDRQRLLRELNLLQSLGVKNIRVLAVSERSNLTRAVHPAVLQGEGAQLNQNILQGLDFLLSEMAKRNMKAVLYMNNFWQWSGGMSQYVNWCSNEKVTDPDVTGKWDEFMQTSAKFYQMEKAQKIYRQVLRKIITRTNTITGIGYNNDPVIMSWQLANEPRPGGSKGRKNFLAFKDWINNTAKYIKFLAPKQLVSTGSEGAAGTLNNESLYEKAHKTPYVDYLTFHLWIKNWGWFDVENPQITYPEALKKSKSYLQDHVNIAERLNKPLVLEEFGVERDKGRLDHGTATNYRDNFYRFLYKFIEKNASSGGVFAGSNFWAWGGYAHTQDVDNQWHKGDDFFGDPPQEKQGLNSVFADDKSTLNIISNHAHNMNLIH